MSETIKIMIVDDHDMVRMGLRTYLMLDPLFEVTAEARDGQEAVEMLSKALPEELPDIVLMDLMMPNMNGAEATKVLMARYPFLKIVILTSFLEDDLVVQAVEAGAASYVLKTVSSDELLYALQGVSRGLPVMTGEVAQALTRGIRKQSVTGEISGMTEREKEVLLLIAEGKSNKEIAEELHISIKTVKTHVSNLLMKFELEDRTQLAIYAHRQGWVAHS